MAKTSDALVAYARRALDSGWVYWYGTTGNLCTENLLSRKRAQYPDHYGDSRMTTYRRHIREGRRCADCINLVKGFVWLDETTGSQRYATGGCPDTNADGMFSRAVEKGPIAAIPELPGLIVRFKGHAGVYIGDGWVIEARGFNYGVVKTRLRDRPWTHWYKMPGISYGPAAEPAEPAFTRNLRRGHTGEDVRLMQEKLIALGYALPKYGADGEFGAETESAVLAFQSDHALERDGIFGPLTHAALTEAAKV